MKISNGMKNKLLLSAIIVTFGILPAISFADTATSSNDKVKENQTIKDEIEAKKEALKNSVDSIKQNALDKMKEQINQYVLNVIERFDAATGRLDKLAQRIDSRISKIEAKNIDVSVAKELLVAARTKIEIAKTSTLYITTDIASSTATSTAALKEEYKIIKDQISKAKDDVKAAQAALVDVVNSLKPGDNKLKNSAASPTATTTNEN